MVLPAAVAEWFWSRSWGDSMDSSLSSRSWELSLLSIDMVSAMPPSSQGSAGATGFVWNSHGGTAGVVSQGLRVSGYRVRTGLYGPLTSNYERSSSQADCERPETSPVRPFSRCFAGVAGANAATMGRVGGGRRVRIGCANRVCGAYQWPKAPGTRLANVREISGLER